MPLQATSGAASYDAFGGGVAAVPNYIEECFSAFLYTGNGSTQTITNGIDLSTKGGLVWTKGRNAITDNQLYDTVRGVQKEIDSNKTNAQATNTLGITAFGTTGYSMGSDGSLNGSGTTYASWTFRKQPKFFDVVTWTGDGTTRNISHNLGSVPGCVIIKRTDTTSNWMVSHRGSVDTWAILNGTNAFTSSAAAGTIGADGYCYLSGSTDTYFRVVAGATGYAAVNATGGTYVAYIFAHNAGGFGLTGTDNVISCGSFTTDGSGYADVTLGYEPQWLMLKRSNGVGAWRMYDNMRGWSNGSTDAMLEANTSNAEVTTNEYGYPTATGFHTEQGIATANYIYIAIRRGPMKVPTSGTSVFALSTWTGSSGNKDLGSQTANFGTGYMSILKSRTAVQTTGVFDALRGKDLFLSTSTTDAEAVDGANAGISVVNNKLQLNSSSYFGAGGDGNGQNYIGWNFRRAPSFFDEVCYTGTGSARTINHNLGVAPELIICKSRSAAGQWPVYSAGLANTEYLNLETVDAKATGATVWNSTTPTTSVFSLGASIRANQSGTTYVAYLFATCAGVSKVGSYTGNSSTQTIDCGFAGGARFVLIKRTNNSGSWFVFDTARGMTTVTDPYLLLNSTGAESNTLGAVTTVTTGFALNDAILTGINTTGGTYIFLAIA